MLRNKICLGLFLMLCLPAVAYADYPSKLPAEREITIDIMQTDISNILSVRGLLSINYTEPLDGTALDMLLTESTERYLHSLSEITEIGGWAPDVTGIHDSYGNDIEYEYYNHDVGYWGSSYGIPTECEKDKKIHEITYGEPSEFKVNSTAQNIFLDLDYGYIHKSVLKEDPVITYDDMYERNDGTFHVVFVSFAPMSVNLPENAITIDEKTETCYKIGFDDISSDILHFDRSNSIKYGSFEEFKKNTELEIHYHGIEFMVAPSPSKQLKNWIAKQDIACYSDKILYLNGDTPLCLTPTTFEKLTLRGYFDR